MSIIIKNLEYTYNQNTPFESKALNGINLEIENGQMVGLIGHTGSGKSTLIQHLNGLIKPTSGNIIIDGIDITKKDIKLSEIRKEVGVVFQYPEYQLFEETIYKDIAFGPSNLGLNQDQIEKRVRESMDIVGLDFHNFKNRSPFELSGGQKRRVAIAGIIAMKPKVLILDEPTAGLDPKSKYEILNQIKMLRDKYNITIIISSHSMEDMASIADKIVVMYNGKIEVMGKPKEVFKNGKRLKEIGLDVPQVLELVMELRKKGFDISDDIITIQEAKNEIIAHLRRKKNND